MATYSGRDGIVKAADAGGTVVAVAEVRSWSIDEEQETVEDTAMGATTRSYKTGFKAWTGSFECWWDPTDTTGQTVMDGNVELELYPAGTSTGDTYYKGPALVTTKSRNATFDGNIEASFSFQGRDDLQTLTVT
jgi:hypothetical protein